MFLNIFFTAKCGNFSLEFCTFSFFLDDLVTNKFRKVVESNMTMERFPSSLSLSLCCLAFLSFFSLTFNLSLSLSLLNSFVDAALQWLLYGVRSSSITLISGPFNQAKSILTKHWLGTDEANRSPVV